MRSTKPRKVQPLLEADLDNQVLERCMGQIAISFRKSSEECLKRRMSLLSPTLPANSSMTVVANSSSCQQIQQIKPQLCDHSNCILAPTASSTITIISCGFCTFAFLNTRLPQRKISTREIPKAPTKHPGQETLKDARMQLVNLLNRRVILPLGVPAGVP